MGYFTIKGRSGTPRAMIFYSTLFGRTFLFITLFSPPQTVPRRDRRYTERMGQTERHLGFGYQLGVTGQVKSIYRDYEAFYATARAGGEEREGRRERKGKARIAVLEY